MAESDQLTFSHYEKLSNGVVAVFNYRYPQVDYRHVYQNGEFVTERQYIYTARFNRLSLELRYRNLTQCKYDASLTRDVLANWPKETA